MAEEGGGLFSTIFGWIKRHKKTTAAAALTVGGVALLGTGAGQQAVQNVANSAAEAGESTVLDGLENTPTGKALSNFMKSISKLLSGLFSKMGLGFLNDMFDGDSSTTDNSPAAAAARNRPGFLTRTFNAVRSTVGGWFGMTSLSKPVAQAVGNASQKYGCDPTMMTCVALIESGGNPTASNASGAAGLYQFMPGTAASFGVTNPYDINQSAEGMARLTNANRSSLAAGLNRAPTNGELYLAHQQGSAGALALLRDPNRNVVDALATVYGGDRGKAAAAVVQNGGRTNMTAGQFADKWIDTYNAVEAKVVANGAPRPTTAPTTQEAQAHPATGPTKVAAVDPHAPRPRDYSGLSNRPTQTAAADIQPPAPKVTNPAAVKRAPAAYAPLQGPTSEVG